MSWSYIFMTVAVVTISTSTVNVSSFTFPTTIRRITGSGASQNNQFIRNNNNHKIINKHNNNNNNIKPPFSTSNNNHNEWDDNDNSIRKVQYIFNETTANMTTTNEKLLENENVDTTTNVSNVTMMISRGGSSSSTANNNGQNQQKRRVELNKRQQKVETKSNSPVSNAIQYWKNLFQTSITQASIPFQQLPIKVSNVFKSQKLKDQDQLMEKLRTVTIKKVIIKSTSSSGNSNSNTNDITPIQQKQTTVLPKDVVDIAVRSCNMIGSPLRSNIVSDFAEIIKRWYVRNGYILHNVIGATLLPDSGIAEIQVDEPYCSSNPVDIIFVKEMIYDNTTKELLSIKQYKDKYFSSSSTSSPDRSSSSSNSKQQSTFNKNQYNITYIVTNGRTKAQRIADALQLFPYQSFQWQSHRWNTIKQSGLFNNIIDATPKSLKDGSVQLCIVATEAPCRHLEYGIGKSLYTGIWEAEIDFEHTNVLGGGETIGISIKRQAPLTTSSTAIVSPVSLKTQQRTSVLESSSTSTTTVESEMDTDTAHIAQEKVSFFRNIMSRKKNKNQDATSNNNNQVQSSSSTSLLQIQPSIRIKYSDGRLQQDGGYNVELFRDYLLNNNNNNNIPTILKKDDTGSFKNIPKNSKSTSTGTGTGTGTSSSSSGSRNAVTWFKRRRMRQQTLTNNMSPPLTENDIEHDMISSSSSNGSSVPILVQQQQQDTVNVDETHYDIYSSTNTETGTSTATTTATMDSTPSASSSTLNNSGPLHDEESAVNDSSYDTGNAVDDIDNDMLYDRRGATIRFNNPIDTRIIQNSIASASIEQITTINGNTEAIGSTTWDIGPFMNQLPLLDARTNFDFSITAGTRIARQQRHRRRLKQQQYNENDNNVAANDNVDDTVPYATVTRGGGGVFMNGRNRKTNDIVLETKVLPFSTISATTRQIFPLFDSSSSNDNSWNRFRDRTRNSNQQQPVQRRGGTSTGQKRSIVLAFKHGVIISTPNLPRHTMQAHGTASTIRGLDGSVDPSGRVSSAIQGTIELRVPVQIPDIRIVRTPNTKFGFKIQRFNNNNNLNRDDTVVTADGTQQAIIPMQLQQQQQRQQDGSVVVFSDWAITTQDYTIDTIHRKSNIGLGMRKTISGLPVQYDITYIHKDKKIKASFGLGKDFDF